MTLVLTQEGELMSDWGMRDFSVLPNKEKALHLIKNLTKFYRTYAKPYLYAGRMIPTPTVECSSVVYTRKNDESKVALPAVLSSAWEAEDGSRALILVNPEDVDVRCMVNGAEVSVPALDATLMMIS